MRPAEKRDGTTQEIRVGRHRDKLEEIRESLKAFEHENNSSNTDHSNENGESSSSRHEYAQKSRVATTFQRMPTEHEMVYRNVQHKDVVNRNGNTVQHTVDETRIHTSPSSYRPPPSYHANNNVSPVFQRPPPPAYDAPSNTQRVTPVPFDTHRTHLHIKTQPKSNKMPIQHYKNMAPPPPGKSTISIETNIPDAFRNMAISSSGKTQPLYHTSLDKKTANSVVSINVASPQTTRINVGDSPISSKSFLIGPRYTSDADRTKIFVNYTDELRQDPRLVPSTSAANENVETMNLRHMLFKPPNLDITFQAMNQYGENLQRQDVKRCTSPIDKSILEMYSKNTRRCQACKPNMFRFYMEQHVERLLQQYREREKRMRQLEKEMNAAELPTAMRQRMLEFLQQKESRYTRLRRQKMSKDHFTILKPIGVGAFGKVLLVRKKDTGKAYAMKCLEKADIIMKQQAAHVKAERDILAEADSPWIVRLFFSFQDESCLYFIMEYVPGGDMMTLLIQKGIFEESLARFYIAELTCAIEYVHSVGFIHRDIKPDNILIDQFGHIKLTDFGLCTGLRWTHDRRYYGPENEHQRMDSFSLPPEIEKNIKVLSARQQTRRIFAHSVVGTGNYMAPEVITRSGHTQSCDWWSMGVILYEMVFGRVPFHAENAHETQFRIVNWRQFLDLSCGAHLTMDCLDMVTSLVCDVPNRLGSHGGASQIKRHPWFKGIDFTNLRKSRAEYIPQVSHAEDTSNFDTFELNDKIEPPKVRSINNPAFYEFTYRHFFDTDSLGCPSLRPSGRRPSLRPLLENGVFDGQSEDDSSHI
ncbi:unnamed protein product [Caenorhabditis bovis]|uniref:non-specific serine/threonine protein kinase n=1 Tax=Caenorhabditis bovis TaxID=2654633 RepID=A0A8S1F8G7_9PELO|nr:unnamed protein product [Caenorhabditis bovis]